MCSQAEPGKKKTNAESKPETVIQMTSALAWKELRESAGIGLLGLLALFAVAVGNMGMSPLPGLIGPRMQGQIPFQNDSFLFQFGFVSCVLAIALGLKQSIGDMSGDAQLFVLHRPVRRTRVYATKLMVGLATYMLLTAAAVLAYAIWAAVPGTHASPFDWKMTWVTWTLWLAMITVYLAAFLSGIRPAAWLGTRLCPLASTVFAAIAILFLLPGWFGWLGLMAFDALLFVLILDVVETRDFA
jgi:hypothetical protein